MLKIDYQPRKIHSVVPFGYYTKDTDSKNPHAATQLTEGGDPDLHREVSQGTKGTDLAYPDPAVLSLLEQALDQLDAGNSYKTASDWLNAQLLALAEKQTPTHTYLSLMGLKRLWDYYRPDHPKKNYNPPKPLDLEPGVNLSRKEVSILRKKRELTQERRKLTVQRTKVKRQEAQLSNKKEKLFRRYGKVRDKGEIQVIKLVETSAPTPVEPVVSYATPVEFLPLATQLHGAYGGIDLPEDDNVFFKPSPGPQEAFLAADEREVLYGGAAGGEPKSWFLPPPFAVRHQNKFRELLECPKGRISIQAFIT